MLNTQEIFLRNWSEFIAVLARYDGLLDRYGAHHFSRLFRPFYKDDILATQKAPGSPTKSALGNGRERDFVIRILIPDSACGMIIGK
jgi:hypothetical protein